MSSKMVDGIKIIKLEETHSEERGRQNDAMTMFRLWSLITGDTSTRDQTIGHRKVL